MSRREKERERQQETESGNAPDTTRVDARRNGRYDTIRPECADWLCNGAIDIDGRAQVQSNEGQCDAMQCDAMRSDGDGFSDPTESTRPTA